MPRTSSIARVFLLFLESRKHSALLFWRNSGRKIAARFCWNCSSRPVASSGFALVELTIALAILALVAAVALPGSSRTAGPSRVRAEALEVVALLKADRNLAISRGQEIVTRVDAAGQSIVSGAAGTRTLASNAVALTFSTRGDGGILFHPDGSSTGGTITLQSRVAAYRIDVTAITGYIALYPVELPR